jgi:hypothetical protein
MFRYERETVHEFEKLAIAPTDLVELRSYVGQHGDSGKATCEPSVVRAQHICAVQQLDARLP